MSHPPVLIVGRFPPPRDGQAIATERLASLIEDAHDVRRVSLSAPEGAYALTHAPLRSDRVRHYLHARRSLRAALAAAPRAPVLWPAISPTPIGHARDLLTVVPAFRPGQPVIAVVHRGDFAALFRSLATRLTGQRLIRRLHRVVFLSTRLAEACAAWVPPAKRFVIPNTIDEGVRCDAGEVAAKRAARRGREALRLLFLSNMIPSKGWMDVLEAVALLRARGVAVEADFAGRWHTPEGATTFARFVAGHGLGGVVRHHGGLSEAARIRALYLDADVFLLPTYYPTEAQPLTILEALNAGTPVVATAHAGIPDIVREGQEGILVPPKSPTALADAVTRLHEVAAWTAYSRRARARFESAFDPAVVKTQWETLLSGPSLSS